ncbi:hypothetical protein NDU88_008553 [Pleurodeles waltl]|uniref:Uncharacterized protein n=1 Tax=Pleurodeles waltl TaxID=8319 RepID=A0AAV7RV29_PLEWA|nr:hypothetical protein NDU88_008553 [Pleurodeles waltl]
MAPVITGPSTAPGRGGPVQPVIPGTADPPRSGPSTHRASCSTVGLLIGPQLQQAAPMGAWASLAPARVLHDPRALRSRGWGSQDSQSPPGQPILLRSSLSTYRAPRSSAGLRSRPPNPTGRSNGHPGPTRPDARLPRSPGPPMPQEGQSGPPVTADLFLLWLSPHRALQSSAGTQRRPPPQPADPMGTRAPPSLNPAPEAYLTLAPASLGGAAAQAQIVSTTHGPHAATPSRARGATASLS